MKSAMNIGIACGGTGGHIFPGLVIAEVLKKRGHNMVLWLAGGDVENTSIKNWDGAVVSVRARGFPAGFSFRSVAVVARLFAVFLQCRKRMKENPPDVLLAMGSYASVGPVLAARNLGVPVVLHEANAIPGRAISLLSRFAAAVALAFEAARQHLRHPKIVFTGFPVRQDLSKGSYGQARFEEGVLQPGIFTVLVMGGSQGAHRLNEIASSALSRLYERGIPVQIVHLTGRKDEPVIRQIYEKAGIHHLVFDFLKDMGKAYNCADLAVARSGAATCAEISACTVPALFVPLPSAPRDHQMANARTLGKSGGVDVVAEKNLTVEWLAAYIEECYRNPEKLDRMRDALKTVAVPDAAEKLAELVEDTWRIHHAHI